MRRLVVAGFAALALVGLTAMPSQASGPTFFFERSFFARSAWSFQPSGTEQVTTAVSFYTGDRSYPTPGPRETLTHLNYWQETSTLIDGVWVLTSQTYGMAHTDLGHVITYTVGQGGRSITASATVPLTKCIPAWPDCTPDGSAPLNASWAATTGPVSGAGGFHATDWWGFGCEVDFASGSNVGYQASINAALGGVTIGGDLQRSFIDRFNNVEVNFCLPDP